MLRSSLMIHKILRRSFSFLKMSEERAPRQVTDSANSKFKEIRPVISDKDSIKIELSNLKFENESDDGLLKSVPQLKHGLDAYLNGELVFGDKGVGNLPHFDNEKDQQFLESISGFIPPSEDQTLLKKSKETNRRYFSSTSSISGPLVCLYYIFSNFREPETGNIYSGVSSTPKNWMISYRKPTTFFLIPKEEDQYAIVQDKGMFPVSNRILMNLGHVIEFFLTNEKQDMNALMKGQYNKKPNNYYRYAKVNNDLLLRSQIDCLSYDKKGKPYVFEIKSRACAPIRYDVENYKLYTDYEISSKRGFLESFEREYFDLIRGGFLKYVLQVKIGGMDGAFIAYHNTEKIYGYQYVKLKQMALRVFGDEYNLDVSFVITSKMLTIVLDNIRRQFQSQFGKNVKYKIGFFSEFKLRKLIVMVEPMVEQTEYETMTQTEYKDIFEYYKERPLKNPVFKIQFDFFVYVNGIRLMSPDVLLTPHDGLQVRYKASKKIPVCQKQYCLFLYQAYKEEQIYNNNLYRGMWGYELIQD